ncbi:MAG: major capsid protein [Thermodesulfobacteriota bacterium]
MLDSAFKARNLTAAINTMRPVKTPVLDAVFARKSRQDGDLFGWDVKFSARRLLPNIRVEAPATVRDKVGAKFVTCSAPRFAEKRFISAASLNSARAFGSEFEKATIEQKVAENQFDMRGDVDRTREFMAVKALQGQVVDEAGTVLVDYGFAAGQKPVLEGEAVWTHANSDPIGNIRAWKKLIADSMDGVDGFLAFCGGSAMTALLKNASVRALLGYQKGAAIAEAGQVTRLAGLGDIQEYFGTYKNSAGATQQLFPEDVFCLVGLSADHGAELYAPIVDLKAAGGVGNALPAEVFFSKSWEEEEPSGRWVKAEARPLPILYRPDCVVWADVL